MKTKWIFVAVGISDKREAVISMIFAKK